jgi:hypothetical protein
LFGEKNNNKDEEYNHTGKASRQKKRFFEVIVVQ